MLTERNPAVPTERLPDRTHLGPDHRAPDDLPLPGTEDLTPFVADHTVVFALNDDGHPVDARWSSLEPIDLDFHPGDLKHLVITVRRSTPVSLDGLEVVTPALRPGLL